MTTNTIELLNRGNIKTARAVFIERVVHDVTRTGISTRPWAGYTLLDQYKGWINFFGERLEVWTWRERGRGEPNQYSTWEDDTG